MVDRGRKVWAQGGCLLAASVALAMGLALALHHPLAPVVVSAAFLLWGAWVAWRPGVWLFVLPAALPLLNFAPWTGWITVEEFDLLCLGAVCGGYARRGFSAAEPCDEAGESSAQRRLFTIAAIVFAVASAVACVRGMSMANDAVFSLFQGYADPLNAWRVIKSVVFAALLWPLLRRDVQSDPSASVRRLAGGMVAGLGVVALAVLWERLAYTGLWDFSTRYRTTALFWEMHVGGAALDGFLALTVPFALRELAVARRPVRWGAAAAVLALAAYACLTTFSRGVYLAIPIGALAFMGLHIRQQNTARPAASTAAIGLACQRLSANATAWFDLQAQMIQ